MRYGRNVLAALGGQVVSVAMVFVATPMLLSIMGQEAYGLVAVYTALQASIALLDLGLSSTLVRSTARFRGQEIEALEYVALFRSFLLFFLGMGVLAGGVLWLGADWIATVWLTPETLSADSVAAAMGWMGCILTLRFWSGLYRGVVTGAEALVWLSVVNTIMYTLRFLGVIPVLIWLGPTPSVFFAFQAVIAVLELVVLAWKTHRFLPPVTGVGWSFRPLRAVLGFSLSLAFSAMIWLLITQVDKVFLSGLLTLSAYATLSIGVLVANVLVFLASAVSGTIMPRLAMLYAEGGDAAMVGMYRTMAQFMAFMSAGLGALIVVFAEPLLLAWSGDIQIASEARPVLQLYAIGNCFMNLAAFPYYAQYAKGDLRLHVYGNIGFAVTLVPALIGAAWMWGGVGAAAVWAGFNVLFFFLWAPFVHHMRLPSLGTLRFMADLLPVMALPFAVAWLLYLWVPVPVERWPGLSVLALIGLLTILTALAAATRLHAPFLGLLRRLRG